MITHDLAAAIRAFILAVTFPGSKKTELPGDAAHEILLHAVQKAFDDSRNEGVRLARVSLKRVSVAPSRSLPGRAVQVISDISAKIKEKAASIISKLAGLVSAGMEGDSITADDIEQQIADWASAYAVSISGDLVHSIIEEAVIEGLVAADISMVVCVTQDDDHVCRRCQDNEDQGPIPIGTPFSSGQEYAPFHPNCRCHVAPEGGN